MASVGASSSHEIDLSWACFQESGVLSRGVLRSPASLLVAPGRVLSWAEFIEQTPEYSIALDGFVSGNTAFSTESHHANFNHHEGAERLETRSTAGQVAFYLKMGFLRDFCGTDRQHIHVYLNHADQDSSLASWLLLNSDELLRSTVDSRIEALISLEGRLDVSCGLYPANPQSRIFKESIWVFAPYTDVRAAGRACNMSSHETTEVVMEIHRRLNLFCVDQAEEIEPDLRFEVMGGGPGWTMVREIGAHCRTVFKEHGITAFVSFLGERNGRFYYSFVKATPLTEFPITELFASFNASEEISIAENDCWNGSSICGGPPRVSGSRYSPEELESFINQKLLEYRAGKQRE